VLATGRGRIILGRHPRGVDATTARLAQAFEAADFDVTQSEDIAADKWLKLCVNTLSPVNALVRRSDHIHPAFVRLKIRLLVEARDTLRAAGVAAVSCDDRDRGLDAEIAHLEASLSDGSSVRDLPLYNAVWAALKDTAKPLEADEHHGRILEHAHASGCAAPTHANLRRIVVDTYAYGRGPELFGAAELLAACEGPAESKASSPGTTSP
jgi:ketopantoate reductase